MFTSETISAANNTDMFVTAWHVQSRDDGLATTQNSRYNDLVRTVCTPTTSSIQDLRASKLNWPLASTIYAVAASGNFGSVMAVGSEVNNRSSLK